MSLATLVDYAQHNFGTIAESTSQARADGLDEGAGDSVGLARSPRAPIPDWLRNRRPEQEAPAGEHPWRIHGEVPVPLPPPDIDKVGPDALAFYVPFHLYRDDWGIYIRDSGVKYLACVLKGSALVPGDEQYLSEAEWILLEHEMWHAATEIACTRAELLARRSLYRPYFWHRDGSLHEEALANAYALRRVFGLGSEASSERSVIERWMRRQGPGYRDFEKWIPSQKFLRGQNMAARFMTESLPRPVPKAAGDPHQFIFRRAFAYPSMPVRRIVEVDAADASVVRPFPRQHGMQVFVYSNDHEPPHFHIKGLSNDAETRYLWPALVPYDGNPRLTGSEAKAFDKYWQAHKRDIVSKLRKVYQRANAR